MAAFLSSLMMDPAEIWHMLPNPGHTDSRNPGIGYQADNAAAERFFATRVPGSVGRAGVCVRNEPRWLTERRHQQKLEHHHFRKF